MQISKDIQTGDLLTFQGKDKNYKALLCTSTYRFKSPFYFTFAVLTYDQLQKPSKNDLLECNFFGTTNTKDGYFKYSEKELEKMWFHHPEIKPYCLGSYGLLVWRKDFLEFHDNFERIDTINIITNLDKNGNGSINGSSWEFLTDFFNEKYRPFLYNRGQKPFSIKSILQN